MSGSGNSNSVLPPEEFARFLSENVTDYAFVTFDRENRITSWSKGAERILGYTEEEALGHTGALIFTEEDRARGEPEREFRTAVTNGRADDERWHRRKDGGRFWGSGVMTALRGAEGELTGCAKVMRDLTERRQAEAAVRASEERLRLFLENVREYALLQTNLDGQVTSWHPGAEALFGYSPDEMVGRSFGSLLIPEDRATEVLTQEMDRLAEGNRSEAARWMVRKDGSRFWARCVTEPVRDEAGTLRGAAKVLRDETDRERMEQAVRASHREFQAVANLVPDLLWSNDASGEPTWHNQRWLDYTGLTLDQSRGTGWLAAIYPDDQPALREGLSHALSAGTTLHHQSRIRRHDGVHRWFLMRVEPVRDESGQISRWFGAATDIDEQRVELDLARDELRALAARLMTMQEEEQRRIARELHDSIGQQLAASQAELSLARKLADSTPAEQMLTDSERRLGRISAEVRELSHRLHPSVLSDLGLAAALRSLVAEFERAHGSPVATRLDEAKPVLPLDTATVIYRIAQEALRNAAKHAGAGAQVTMTLSEAAGCVRFTVADTGSGFDPAARRANGGLGLVSMRERARLAGGTLRIETALGQGTTLVLDVPRRKTGVATKPKALIADDHATSRYILRRFSEADCEIVAEVSNGIEALEAAERFQPDLAILDVSMPGMGGIETARCLRERLPNVRIIFASQHTAREYVEEAFRAGAQGYVVKQAAPTEVGEAIREVLAGGRYRSPLTRDRGGR